MIDVSEVERTIVGTLAADATLTALLPDGVYWDLAPPGSTRFATVSASTSRAQMEFQGVDSFRAIAYLVKAVVLGSGGATVAQADARIQAILDRQPIALPPATGAGLMVIHWLDRVRYTESVNNDVWQHSGARYEVIVTPI